MCHTISVVMPCYNSALTVKTSVLSVLAQRFTDFELLIVDDGSTDSSIASVSSVNDSRIRLIQQENAGVSAARNAGIREARGRYLAFLDADDTWHPMFLARMFSALNNRKDAVLAYCGWQNLGLSGSRGEPFIPPEYETTNKLEILFTGCRWPIHAALVNRQAVLEAGGFDITLENAEDYALWLAVASQIPIVRVPEMLAYYHFHADSQASANRLRAAMHQLAAQESFLKKNPRLRDRLGRRHARRLMYAMLLQKGYECYWSRDLTAARTIFRRVLAAGQAKPTDLKYLLPALLPQGLHRWLLATADAAIPERAEKTKE